MQCKIPFLDFRFCSLYMLLNLRAYGVTLFGMGYIWFGAGHVHIWVEGYPKGMERKTHAVVPGTEHGFLPSSLTVLTLAQLTAISLDSG